MIESGMNKDQNRYLAFPLAKFSIVLASINRDNNAPIQKAKK